jgi:hypothetical protein
VRETTADLRATLAAARSIRPGGGAWHTIAVGLAEEGWRRGLEELRRAGPDAALPFLALAVQGEAPDPLRETLYRYYLADKRGDAHEAARLRDHMYYLGLPEEVAALVDGSR